MKKMMTWVLAATLICGSSVFTSCSHSEDNPMPEPAKKNRTAFVQHTRSALKELAENLNFTSWEAANTFNTYFNQHVLSNPEFKNSVLLAAFLQAMNTLKDVEEGSEMAAMGYKKYFTVDLNDFKYRFTMKADNKNFDKEEADNFEIILNGFNPKTQQLENGLYKLSFKTSGVGMQRIVPIPNTDNVGCILYIVPSEFQFSLASKFTGDWHDDFSGVLHFQLPEGATDNSKGFAADATINSDIFSNDGKKDNTQLTVSVVADRVNSKGNTQIGYVQNGRKMLDMTMKLDGIAPAGTSIFDRSQYTTSSSFLDVISTLLTGRSLEEGTITLLDDLTFTFSISDMQKRLELARENHKARRHYADQQTIDQYTQQLNEIIKASMICKGVDQTIPMRLVTTKFGIDYVSMPSFNFADENGYVSLIDLLDAESVQYGINILDHSVEPLQQSVIVVRQLLEFVTTFTKSVEFPLAKE